MSKFIKLYEEYKKIIEENEVGSTETAPESLDVGDTTKPSKMFNINTLHTILDRALLSDKDKHITVGTPKSDIYLELNIPTINHRLNIPVVKNAINRVLTGQYLNDFTKIVGDLSTRLPGDVGSEDEEDPRKLAVNDLITKLTIVYEQIWKHRNVRNLAAAYSGNILKVPAAIVGKDVSKDHDDEIKYTINFNLRKNSESEYAVYPAFSIRDHEDPSEVIPFILYDIEILILSRAILTIEDEKNTMNERPHILVIKSGEEYDAQTAAINQNQADFGQNQETPAK